MTLPESITKEIVSSSCRDCVFWDGRGKTMGMCGHPVMQDGAGRPTFVTRESYICHAASDAPVVKMTKKLQVSLRMSILSGIKKVRHHRVKRNAIPPQPYCPRQQQTWPVVDPGVMAEAPSPRIVYGTDAQIAWTTNTGTTTGTYQYSNLSTYRNDDGTMVARCTDQNCPMCNPVTEPTARGPWTTLGQAMVGINVNIQPVQENLRVPDAVVNDAVARESRTILSRVAQRMGDWAMQGAANPATESTPVPATNGPLTQEAFRRALNYNSWENAYGPYIGRSVLDDARRERYDVFYENYGLSRTTPGTEWTSEPSPYRTSAIYRNAQSFRIELSEEAFREWESIIFDSMSNHHEIIFTNDVQQVRGTIREMDMPYNYGTCIVCITMSITDTLRRQPGDGPYPLWEIVR